MSYGKGCHLYTYPKRHEKKKHDQENTLDDGLVRNKTFLFSQVYVLWYAHVLTTYFVYFCMIIAQLGAKMSYGKGCLLYTYPKRHEKKKHDQENTLDDGLVRNKTFLFSQVYVLWYAHVLTTYFV